MTNREMITYLREELNENRHIVLYLNSLKSKMECLDDSSVIQNEIDRLTDYINEIRDEFHELLQKEWEDEYERYS